MPPYKYLTTHYLCDKCKKKYEFSDPKSKRGIRMYRCKHFELKFIKNIDNAQLNYFLKIKCLICYKKQDIKNIKINNYNQNNQIQYNKYNCCGNKINIGSFFSNDENNSIDNIIDLLEKTDIIQRNNNQNNFNNNKDMFIQNGNMNNINFGMVNQNNGMNNFNNINNIPNNCMGYININNNANFENNVNNNFQMNPNFCQNAAIMNNGQNMFEQSFNGNNFQNNFIQNGLFANNFQDNCAQNNQFNFNINNNGNFNNNNLLINNQKNDFIFNNNNDYLNGGNQVYMSDINLSFADENCLNNNCFIPEKIVFKINIMQNNYPIEAYNNRITREVINEFLKDHPDLEQYLYRNQKYLI